MSYLFVQLHSVLDSKLRPKPGRQCMHRQPFPPWLEMSKWLQELGVSFQNFMISCHFWFLETAARWGSKALYTSCLSVSSSKILDAKCVRCMRMHEGSCGCINFHFTQLLIPQQDRVTQIVHQWTQQPQTKLKFNKCISISDEKTTTLTMTWTNQAFRTELWENPRNFFRSTCACQSCKATKVLSSIENNRIVKWCQVLHTPLPYHGPHIPFHRLRQIVRWRRCGSDGMDTPQAWIARV